ncbi:hypothetical protein BDW75DRAFT_244142 [Aspergillus navahoensis]
MRYTGTTRQQMKSLWRSWHPIDKSSKKLGICEGVQRSLRTGVFLNCELHPAKEKGPLRSRESLREMVMEHAKKKERLGAKSWPAVPKMMSEEARFCDRLDSKGCPGGKELAW